MEEENQKRNHHRNAKYRIPRRAPSIVAAERQREYITPDKTTCAECTCFPPDPYIWNKKLNPCLKSPFTLYELAAKVVNDIPLPEAFGWSVSDVAEWMVDVVGLPEYEECMIKNNIDGKRLLFLEDPSKFPDMNIRHFEHIKLITSRVRGLFSVDFIRFVRSIALPPRKPLTHCTWFKSRTGPTWGVRQLWDSCDVLRWMKVIMPEPLHMDHWDLVWYQKPDFPRVKFARLTKPPSQVYIPRYELDVNECSEYMTPRKFRLISGLGEDQHFIWMEHPPDTTVKVAKRRHQQVTTMPIKQVPLTGLTGDAFLLAKRKMIKPKFLP